MKQNPRRLTGTPSQAYRLIFRSFGVENYEDHQMRITPDTEVHFTCDSIAVTRILPKYTKGGLSGFDSKVELLDRDNYVVVYVFAAATQDQEIIGQGRTTAEPLLGLIDLMLGKGILDELVSEDIERTISGATYTRGDLTLRRVPDEPKDIAAENRLARFESAAKLISKAGGIDDRTRTALRWYRKGIMERNAVDRFLAFWISLETATGVKNGNPTHIAVYLSRVLNKDSSSIKSQLCLGELYRLRGEILHSGKTQVKKTGRTVTSLTMRELDLLKAIVEECLHFVIEGHCVGVLTGNSWL